MKWMLFFLIADLSAEVLIERGKKTGLLSWEWRQDGISLRLIQRLPDQTRAYALSRGLNAQQADILARSCFFGSMFRNDSRHRLDFNLNDWRILVDGRTQKLWTRQTWRSVFQASTAAQVGLNWSLLPTEQHFEPGDYNWGMTVYGLPPGHLFDLQLIMQIDGQKIESVIPLLQCAEDRSAF